MTDVDLSECPFDTDPMPAIGFEPNELDLLDHDPWGVLGRYRSLTPREPGLPGPRGADSGLPVTNSGPGDQPGPEVWALR